MHVARRNDESWLLLERPIVGKRHPEVLEIMTFEIYSRRKVGQVEIHLSLPSGFNPTVSLV